MICVVGFGRMGATMLDALRNAGFDARGFDVVPKDSPHITDDVTAVRGQADMLISVVRDIPQTGDVLLGALDSRLFDAGETLPRAVQCKQQSNL